MPKTVLTILARVFALVGKQTTPANKCQQMPTANDSCQQLPTSANKCPHLPTNAYKCLFPYSPSPVEVLQNSANNKTMADGESLFGLATTIDRWSALFLSFSHAEGSQFKMQPNQKITPSQFLRIGLEHVGFERARQLRTRLPMNLQRFRSAFGVGPGAVAAAYRDIQITANPDARINKPNSFYFLVALNWLSTYKKEVEMSGFFHTDEKTLRKHIQFYVIKIAALKEEKIVWDNGDDEVYLLSVDGVHFRTNEPRTDPSAKWCSHKFKSAAVGYELGISIYKQRLVWIKGPFKAATHDFTVYKGSLGKKIPAGKRCIADRGYRGDDYKHQLSIRNRDDAIPLRNFKKRVRARHENFNARIKNFSILEQRFRHGIPRHKAVLEAVCVLVQYDMENGHPLMDV